MYLPWFLVSSCRKRRRLVPSLSDSRPAILVKPDENVFTLVPWSPVAGNGGAWFHRLSDSRPAILVKPDENVFTLVPGLQLQETAAPGSIVKRFPACYPGQTG
jgi:hypothetical protein